ncbi:MAG TPA: hypothetical protein VMI10_21180 [Terriglobales bacterium]|nr:hypothetical protein [Terriglobales bacterium]
MAEALEQAQHEFWRPPVKAAEVAVSQDRSETCTECGTEFIVGSRFCHSCGASRKEVGAAQTVEVPGLAELSAVGKRFGLSKAALAAFLFGLFCMVGAVTVGILFTARTTLDWQAIQLWRIEWLLGAIASFSAGLLLKKSA